MGRSGSPGGAGDASVFGGATGGRAQEGKERTISLQRSFIKIANRDPGGGGRT